MSDIAIVFPGQGAQRSGMAKDFHDEYAVAREVFTQADRYLPFDVRALCFESNTMLDETVYTQPAILTAEIAMWRALAQQRCLNSENSYFAGHSLGEYAALVAAEVMPFEVAIQIVARRAELMQAVAVQGGMAAVIMPLLPLPELRALVSRFGVDVANDNSKEQTVISGELAALSHAIEAIETTWPQACRIVPLRVSAPFHSRHMQQAEVAFRPLVQGFMAQCDLRHAPRVLSNFSGGWHLPSEEALVDALVSQLSGTVRWQENMQALLALGSSVLEIGPGRPLRGFFRSLGVETSSISRVNQLQKWVAAA